MHSHEERAEKTSHSMVFVERVKGADAGLLRRGIEELLAAVDGADERAVYEGLRRLIPEFTGEKPAPASQARPAAVVAS